MIAAYLLLAAFFLGTVCLIGAIIDAVAYDVRQRVTGARSTTPDTE